MTRFNCAFVVYRAANTGSKSFPRSAAAAIVVAAVLAILGAVPAFGQPSQQASALGCEHFNWRAELRKDQASILSKVPLHVDDMVSALSPGGALEAYELDHFFAELLGNGTTLSLKDQTQFGRPEFFLFYAGRPSTVPDSVDPTLPKDPYTLTGWGYFVVFDYTDPQPPAQTQWGFAHCIPPQDWLIHEAGFHMSDGSFFPTPGAPFPPDPPPPPPDVFFWHPRVWDLHVWINLCGSPVVGLMNQHPDGRLLSGAAGYSAPTGSFFYPPIPGSGPIRQVQGRVCSPIDSLPSDASDNN